MMFCEFSPVEQLAPNRIIRIPRHGASVFAMRWLAVVVLLFGLAFPLERTFADRDQLPNIVLIMADEMGYSHIGCYGGELRTPHIRVDSYFKVLPGCPVYHNDQLAIPPTSDPPNQLHPEKEWYTTDVFTDWSLKFIDEAAAEERPFFLYTAYNAPHWPLEAPDETLRRQSRKHRDKRCRGMVPETSQ